MAVADMSPRAVGHVLDDAIAIYRANFKRVIALAGVAVFPVALLYGLTQTFYLRGMFDMFASAVSEQTPISAVGPSGLPTTVLVAYSLSGVASMAYGLAQVYFRGALLSTGASLLERRPPDLKGILRSGMRVFFPLMGVTILSTIAVSVAAGASLLALGAGGAVLAVYLSVVGPAVVIENAGVLDGFRRSLALVRGNFWRVAAFAIGMFLLASQIESALASPILVRDAIIALQHPDTIVTQLPVGWKVLEGLIQASAAVLVLPFVELAWFCCYIDLRARNEGMDLLIRAQELTAGRR